MNSTTLTTVIGAVRALVVAVADYMMHNPMDGGAMKQPTYWLGLAFSALTAWQAFHTQGIEPAKLEDRKV